MDSAWRATNEILARLYAVTGDRIGRTMWELTRPTVDLPRRELRRALARLLLHGVVQPHGRLARYSQQAEEPGRGGN